MRSGAGVDSLMPELIGHTQVQDIINKIVSTRRNHLAPGLKKARNNDLLIFGNPGTGKSMMVRSIARVLAENGILQKTEPIVLNAVTTLHSYLN